MEANRAGRSVVYHRPAGLRMGAWLVVLLVHGIVLLAWWAVRATERPPRPTMVTLSLLPDVPPPPPPPPPPPKPKPLPLPPSPPKPQPAPRPEPRPEPKPEPKPLPPREEQPLRIEQPLQTAPAPAPPAPLSRRRTDGDEWVAPPSVSAPGGNIRRAPSDYAEAVKSRVISKVIYPANAVYPAPKGFKGDPSELRRQCVIPWEVVVDRRGALVSYEIERCEDDLLDAAAEAAILKAQPYPLPPDGAEQYRIYGTTNFVKPRVNKRPG